MDHFQAVSIDYIEKNRYKELFLNHESSFNIICYSRLFPQMDEIHRILDEYLEEETRDRSVLFASVSALDKFLEIYDSREFWDCILVESSQLQNVRPIIDALGIEALEEARPYIDSYIYEEDLDGYKVIDVIPRLSSYHAIDLEVDEFRELYFSSTAYEKRLFIPNINNDELQSILSCIPVSQEDMDRTLIGYTGRRDYTYTDIPVSYQQMLQEITEAADMVIVDDRSEFSRYTRMQYATLINYRPLYKLTQDVDSQQYELEKDQQWLYYKQKVNCIRTLSTQIDRIEQALNELPAMKDRLELEIRTHSNRIAGSMSENTDKLYRHFRNNRDEMADFLMENTDKLYRKFSIIPEKEKELSDLIRKKEAERRLKNMPTTEFTGHVLTFKGKRIFTATSDASDTKDLFHALSNLGQVSLCDEIPFQKLKEWNDNSQNEELLSTLSYYILPVSYDLLKVDDHGYNILIGHVQDIYDHQDWHINVIPVNTQELTSMDWKKMQDIYEAKIGKSQLLDLTGTNNLKPALSFNDLIMEALTLDYNELEKKNAQFRNAFKYNIFISYRQKDRLLAQALIQRLLKDEELKDVGFWYDVHLEAGYSFETQILTEIDKADMAIMLVTDNTLQPTYQQIDKYGYLKDANYISQHEYPDMWKRPNLKILPVAYNMGIDDSSRSLMNDISRQELEAHEIKDAESYKDIVYYTHETDDAYYEMFPGKDNVEPLKRYDPRSIDELIMQIKETSKEKRDGFIDTPEKKYLRAQAIYTGTRTEKNTDAAIKLLEDISNETGNSRYGLKARNMLLKLYINKINTEKDNREILDRLMEVINLKSDYCLKKLNAEQYATIQFPQNINYANQEESGIEDRYGDIANWYAEHRLPMDRYENIILDPNINIYDFDSFTEYAGMDLDYLCDSFLYRISYIEQFLKNMELLYSLSNEEQTDPTLKRKTSVEFMDSVKALAKTILPAIYSMLRTLMAMRTGINIDRIEYNDVKDEDIKGHREYAYVLKSIYAVNVYCENKLCTIWACLKVLQEKCYRFMLIENGIRYRQTHCIDTLKKYMKPMGLKRFNILQALSILKDAPTAILHRQNRYLADTDNHLFNEGFPELEYEIPETYENLKELLKAKTDYNNTVVFEAWVSDKLSEVSIDNIMINNEISRVTTDEVDENEDEEEARQYRKRRFWEETHRHAMKYTRNSYAQYENKYYLLRNPEDLMKESELRLTYREYKGEVQEDDTYFLQEAEQKAWEAYIVSSRQAMDNRMKSRFIKLLQGCISLLQNEIDTGSIEEDDIFLGLFLGKAIEHHTILMRRNQNKANVDELNSITDGLLSLAKHCPSIEEEKSDSLDTLKSLKDNIISQETNRFLLERDYINKATSRSTLYNNEDSLDLAGTTSALLYSSNTKRGAIANYDAYKNLRYCISVIEREKNNLAQDDYTQNRISTLETEYRQLHDKWAFYNDDRITFCKRLAELEQEMPANSGEANISSLKMLMKEYSGSYQENKWDNADATMLSSHIGKLIKKTDAAEIDDMIYSRFINGYCYPYLNENPENQDMLCKYIQNESLRLFKASKDTEYTETVEYRQRIGNIRNFILALKDNSEYLSLERAMTPSRLKREYYIVSRCTPCISRLPEFINEQDIQALEEMYRLEFTPGISPAGLDAETMKDAFTNEFCSDEYKESIKSLVRNIPQFLAGPIFKALEDLLPLECKIAYNHFTERKAADLVKLLNDSGVINEFKEALIMDIWVSDDADPYKYEIAERYPDVVKDIVSANTTHLLREFNKVTTQFSFLRDKDIPYVFSMISQILDENAKLIIYMDDIELIDILYDIQKTLQYYFPVMSPDQKNIWIAMLSIILKQSQTPSATNAYIERMLEQAKAETPEMNALIQAWSLIYMALKLNNNSEQATFFIEDSAIELMFREIQNINRFAGYTKLEIRRTSLYYSELINWDFPMASICLRPLDEISSTDISYRFNINRQAYASLFTISVVDNTAKKCANMIMKNFFKSYIPVLKWKADNNYRRNRQNKYKSRYEKAYIKSNRTEMLRDTLSIPAMLNIDKENIRSLGYMPENECIALIEHVLELNKKRIDSFNLAEIKEQYQNLPTSIEKLERDDFYYIQPDLSDYGIMITDFVKQHCTSNNTIPCNQPFQQIADQNQNYQQMQQVADPYQSYPAYEYGQNTEEEDDDTIQF